eukprot:445301-Pleurochrysis_carterae.AAC.1
MSEVQVRCCQPLQTPLIRRLTLLVLAMAVIIEQTARGSSHTSSKLDSTGYSSNKHFLANRATKSASITDVAR